MAGIMRALHGTHKHLIHRTPNPPRISFILRELSWESPFSRNIIVEHFRLIANACKKKVRCGTAERRSHPPTPAIGTSRSQRSGVFSLFPSVPYNVSFLASIQPQLPYFTQKRSFIFMFMIHKPYVLSKAGAAMFTCLALPSPTPASMRELGHSGLQDWPTLPETS